MNFVAGDIKKAVLNAGFDWFEKGFFNINLIGVRCADKNANTFNDQLFCIFNTVAGSCALSFMFTSDPGTHWRLNPMNVAGTAVLPRGQHKGLFKLGKFKGKYDALVQRREVGVLRDNNADDVIDFDAALDVGWHGICMHMASAISKSSIVGRWSAGCQVLASAVDFALMMAVLKKAATIWGDAFTYTLLDERDVLDVVA